MADSSLAEQEKQIKKLKHDYEGWRELILTFNSILLWEQKWYPAAIGGVNTAIFLLFWLWDPSILTTIATLFLIANIIDCLVPKLISTIYNTNAWNGAKEKKFEQICRTITNYQFHLFELVCKCQKYKSMKPKLYYSILILVLLLLSWIGNQVNNLFLTYLFLSVLLYLPGTLHHHILDRHCLTLTAPVINLFTILKSKIDSNNKPKTN